MKQQLEMNNQQLSLFRGHPNMNGSHHRQYGKDNSTEYADNGHKAE